MHFYSQPNHEPWIRPPQFQRLVVPYPSDDTSHTLLSTEKEPAYSPPFIASKLLNLLGRLGFHS